jgi:hypothetical protein
MAGKGVRSARGELVNFDLLKIKQQIASAPKTTDVKARENFIDQKFKRRLKRAQRQAVEQIAEVVVEPSGLPTEEPAAEEPKEAQ